MLKSCRDDADEMEVKRQDRSEYKYGKAGAARKTVYLRPV